MAAGNHMYQPEGLSGPAGDGFGWVMGAPRDLRNPDIYELTWHQRVDWYRLAEERAQAGLHPREITPQSEPAFARAIHSMVADNVAIDPVMRMNHHIIERGRVLDKLTGYYDMYPPLVQRSAADEQGRIRYQDRMLEYARDGEGEFREISVVFALRREFRHRELRHATRATFALLTAYGNAIRTATEADMRRWLGIRKPDDEA